MFEKIDSSSNSLDSLYSKLFGGHHPPASAVSPDTLEATVVSTLCEWATTSKRSGEHRAFVVAKLLERRQAEMAPPGPESMAVDDDGEEVVTSVNPPYFQQHLFRYLDLDAPTLDSRREFSNLVLLFYELICHDVFSHDSYLSQLIARGDVSPVGGGGGVLAAAGNAGAKGHKDDERGDTDADGSFEDSKINDDLANLLSQIKEGNQLGDHPGPFSPPTPGGTKSDEKSMPDLAKLSRHVQYCYHFPLPADEFYTHEVNQRHVLLYGTVSGVGGGSTVDGRGVKRLCKDIMKLFGKKMSIDVSDGGKVRFMLRICQCSVFNVFFSGEPACFLTSRQSL